jgi:hypothetical protein
MNVRNLIRIAAGLALAAGIVQQAHAVTGCSTVTLSGTFGLQFSGSVTSDLSGGVGGAAAPPGSLTSLARGAGNQAAGYAWLYLDGAGNLFGNAAISLNGAWSEGPVTGTYTVTDDCHFGLTMTDTSGGNQHFDGVVISQGAGAVMLQTDRGAGLTGALQPAHASCQLSDITGSFGFRSTGMIIGGGPTSSIGVVTFDGQGGAAASESRFDGNGYAQPASAGTMAINPDCTVALSLASNTDGTLVNYRGVVVNNLKQIVLVRSDDGTAVTGTLTAQ